jgi:excisionase family DNA binding protein
MKAFYTVKEVAKEFEVTEQSVRNWIRAGEIIAIQPVSNGVIRIPIPALDAFKRKRGILPRIQVATAYGHRETYENVAEYYKATVEPTLNKLNLSSDEVLLRASDDRVFARRNRGLLESIARCATMALDGAVA